MDGKESIMRNRYRITAVIFAVCVVLLGAVWAISTELPAQQAAEPAFTFTVFGDNRPSLPAIDQPEMFRRVLARMAEINPAFALNTGDAIYGSSNPTRMQEMYASYVKTVESLFKPKVYLALGNHEILGSRTNQDFFAKELGAPYYSWDYEDSHFIALDSEVIGEAGRIMGDQLDWLKQDLQKSRAARHKFVFLHRPLYPVDGHKGQCLDQYPKERDALHSLFVRNRITAVFMGHEHLFHEEVRNGVRYIITGGGGASLYPSVEGTGDFYHFVVVSLAGDKVDMKVVKLADHGRPEEITPVGGKQTP